jgi:hypothetical protein
MYDHDGVYEIKQKADKGPAIIPPHAALVMAMMKAKAGTSDGQPVE